MISDKILNQLRNARTQNGMVGMVVSPTGEQRNLAWIAIQIPNRTKGFKEEFKIEYSEYKPEWETDEHDDWDWDYYLLNEETEFATTVDELERKLRRWTTEINKLTPIANLDHPKY